MGRDGEREKLIFHSEVSRAIETEWKKNRDKIIKPISAKKNILQDKNKSQNDSFLRPWEN